LLVDSKVLMVDVEKSSLFLPMKVNVPYDLRVVELDAVWTSTFSTQRDKQ
jgi:hypothetical protein